MSLDSRAIPFRSPVARLESSAFTYCDSATSYCPIADRAVFLEKGRVRFEGQIRDLMERDDLARAVFLGGPEVE